MKAGVVTGSIIFAIADVVFAAPPSPARLDCSVPSVKVKEIHLVGVDRTARRNAELRTGAYDSVAALAARPAARVVVLGFGGNGTAGLPVLLADFTSGGEGVDRKRNLKWLVDVASVPAGSDDAYQECVKGKIEAARSKLLQKLALELAKLDDTKDGNSLIIFTISTAVAPFLTSAQAGVPVTMTVFSDGLEHSSALSFYPGPTRLLPTPSEATAKSKAFPGAWTSIRLTLAGMGFAPDLDASSISSLTALWTAIAADRGAVIDQITTTTPVMAPFADH